MSPVWEFSPAWQRRRTSRSEEGAQMRQAEELVSERQGQLIPSRRGTRASSARPSGRASPFRGIENCVPLIHGSQGCSTYIRRYVISHFKEPIDIASSNFSESSAIFGGGDNLKTALDNLIRQYSPEAIGIATTCLSETIGDDVRLYLDQYREAQKTARRCRPSSMPRPRATGAPTWRGIMRPYGRRWRPLPKAARATAASTIIPGFLSPDGHQAPQGDLAAFGITSTMLPRLFGDPGRRSMGRSTRSSRQAAPP